MWGNLHPADSVSGDFFDFLQNEEDSVGIVVADVSGHGLGPGLLMAQLLAHLRSIAEFFRDPTEMLTQANRLFTRTNTSHFVTMFLGRFDIKTRSFVYASAGHQGYLLKANGKNLTLQSTGIPLGIGEQWRSIENPPAVVLEDGDTLVVATDGFEEQTNSSGEHFGRERLLSVVRDNFTQPARQIVETLCTAVDEFSGELKQGDDVTAVILKVL
jgi:serine phosphatase RsbU (regulator of sigma subunit)